MPPYNFHEMRPGDKFTFPVDPANRDGRGRLKGIMAVRSAACQHSRRHGVKLVVRKLSDTQGVCERVA